MKRRTFLERSTLAAAGLALPGAFGGVSAASQATPALRIDPTPRFELSPYLYMQFMEPLGVTDGSVEAAWDHLRDDWRDDVVEVTRELAPTMLRWGGIFADFYRWREGVGPRGARPPMINLLWGGIESNQVGTAEFVDFCRRVTAEPLVCVNFESDGRRQYMKVKDSVRTGDATGSGGVGGVLQRPRRVASGRPTVTRRRSGSGTGKSGTKRPTTRTASISRPRRARPSSSRRRCARPTRRSG